MVASRRWSVAGSSPHARGTQPVGEGGAGSDRFIPACAGNTRSDGPSLPGRPVHPRMRGEHRSASSMTAPHRGSSPHARGTHSTQPLYRPGSLVHPRMRGEHCNQTAARDLLGGSSPHARGTHPKRLYPHLRQRFIPACAGNTFWSSFSLGVGPVHPRMRGEHNIPNLGQLRIRGSSPHARGTPSKRLRTANAERFIPACAGNTTPECGPASSCPVHPRMRGEHSTGPSMSIFSSGSSPHARGTPNALAWRLAAERFIPACAGNTHRCPHHWRT